jgi:hypothetical protein
VTFEIAWYSGSHWLVEWPCGSVDLQGEFAWYLGSHWLAVLRDVLDLLRVDLEWYSGSHWLAVSRDVLDLLRVDLEWYSGSHWLVGWLCGSVDLEGELDESQEIRRHDASFFVLPLVS